MLFIYPYKQGSKSARELARALGAKLIRHVGSKFKARHDKAVINWGASTVPLSVSARGVLGLPLSPLLNDPSDVQRATNKLLCLSLLEEGEVSVPPFTTDMEEARSWIRNGGMVVCRTILNGHSGNGIVIVEDEEDLILAPLYTRYMKKKDEFRIHVFREEVFDIQKKARRIDAKVVNWQVRNHKNGFIYKREDVNAPEQVLEQAKLAIKVSGLDFGAVDVIWNAHEVKAYVLEINTAPGLEGQTLESYKNIFRKYL